MLAVKPIARWQIWLGKWLGIMILNLILLALSGASHLDAAEVEAMSAPSAERRAWSLADALVAGDAQAATSIYLALRAQGERVPARSPGCLITRRFRSPERAK